MRRGKNCASVTTVAVIIWIVVVGIAVMLLLLLMMMIVVDAVVSDVVALGHDTTERKNVHKAVACGDCGSRKECNRNR